MLRINRFLSLIVLTALLVSACWPWSPSPSNGDWPGTNADGADRHHDNIDYRIVTPITADITLDNTWWEHPHDSMQKIVFGGTVWDPSGPLEAIGSIGGCTATLISEFAALSAAHCRSNGATVTFTLPNSRGSIKGTMVHHPLYEVLKWASYDYAVIKFSHSIFKDKNVNAAGLAPLPISQETLRKNDSVLLYGYGKFGQEGCSSDPDGRPRQASVQLAEIDEDWHYKAKDHSAGLCEGDSGGPMFIYNRRWIVAGVNSWTGSPPDSFAKSTYVASDWIKQNSGDPSLPGDTWGHCVLYDIDVDGSYLSFRGNIPSFTGDSSFWDNRTSQVWVKKGFQSTLYDGANYSSQLATFDGFNGHDCNQFGCLHDVTRSTANNRASSVKCESALPGETWGHCVLYDRYGDSGYLSTQGDIPSFSAEDSFWNNRTSQVWVKRGYTAMLYPSAGYKDNGTGHQRAVKLGGYVGNWCNSYGCLHDLVGTEAENATSSLRCRAD